MIELLGSLLLTLLAILMYAFIVFIIITINTTIGIFGIRKLEKWFNIKLINR